MHVQQYNILCSLQYSYHHIVNSMPYLKFYIEFFIGSMVGHLLIYYDILCHDHLFPSHPHALITFLFILTVPHGAIRPEYMLCTRCTLIIIIIVIIYRSCHIIYTHTI